MPGGVRGERGAIVLTRQARWVEVMAPVSRPPQEPAQSPPIRAVLICRPGAGAVRQYAASRRYLTAKGYEVVSMAPDGAAALALVRAGLVAAVLAAIDGAGDAELVAAVEAAGGTFAYTRSPSRRHYPDPAAEFVLRMHQLGTSAGEIARLLGLPAERVRTIVGTTTQAGRRPRTGHLRVVS